MCNILWAECRGIVTLTQLERSIRKPRMKRTKRLFLFLRVRVKSSRNELVICGRARPFRPSSGDPRLNVISDFTQSQFYPYHQILDNRFVDALARGGVCGGRCCKRQATKRIIGTYREKGWIIPTVFTKTLKNVFLFILPSMSKNGDSANNLLSTCCVNYSR